MEGGLPGNAKKNLYLEIPEDEFGIIFLALILFYLQLCIKSTFNRIVFIFHRGVSTNGGDVIEFPIDTDVR